MSGNSEEVQFNGPFHYDLNFAVSSQLLKELVSSRIQLMGAPYFQIPPGARNLQVVSDKVWVDWPSLEDGLTRRMNAHLGSGAALGTKQWGLVAYEGETVTVRIEYLVDDYWWVECLMPGGMENDEERKAQIDVGSAAALLHIPDSRSNLSDTSENPVWFNAED